MRSPRVRHAAALVAVLIAATAAALQPPAAEAAPSSRANGDIAWIDGHGLWVGDPYGQRRLRVGPGSPYPGLYTKAVA